MESVLQKKFFKTEKKAERALGEFPLMAISNNTTRAFEGYDVPKLFVAGAAGYNGGRMVESRCGQDWV